MTKLMTNNIDIIRYGVGALIDICNFLFLQKCEYFFQFCFHF